MKISQLNETTERMDTCMHETNFSIIYRWIASNGKRCEKNRNIKRIAPSWMMNRILISRFLLLSDENVYWIRFQCVCVCAYWMWVWLDLECLKSVHMSWVSNERQSERYESCANSNDREIEAESNTPATQFSSTIPHGDHNNEQLLSDCINNILFYGTPKCQWTEH